MSLIALLLATIIPLLFLYLIYALDLYRTGAFRYVVGCFLWGTVAYGGVALVNTFVVTAGIVDQSTMVRFTAPLTEEILKALILIVLVRRPQFNYFVDGAIYGFAAGIGFAIFENYQYITEHAGAALDVALGRVLSTNLIHATASALVGVALGLTRFQRLPGRVILLSLGWLFAFAIHTAFNNLLVSVSSLLLFLYAVLSGIGGLALIAPIIKRGLAEEKSWIEESLGAADRVTPGEASVVHRLDNIDHILRPLAERFGANKASQIETILVYQAQLGIMRKSLEKLATEDLKRQVKLQMEEVREKMEAARREAGAYCMLYLRNIFPEESSPIWGRLENLIQMQAASPQPTWPP